jgi:prophage regulatory protein
MNSEEIRVRLPASGLVRLDQFVGRGRAIPCGKSTWWAGVKEGRFPPPVKLGPRITAWRVEDIRAVIDGSGQARVASDSKRPRAAERAEAR